MPEGFVITGSMVKMVATLVSIVTVVGVAVVGVVNHVSAVESLKDDVGSIKTSVENLETSMRTSFANVKDTVHKIEKDIVFLRASRSSRPAFRTRQPRLDDLPAGGVSPDRMLHIPVAPLKPEREVFKIPPVTPLRPPG